MIIYHGSDHIVEKPMYGFGNLRCDYGQGFYCTEDINLAQEWAVDEQRDGYANCYELDMTNLKVLELNGEQYHILNWLAILLENRIVDFSGEIARAGKDYIISEYMIDYSSYDVIKGYRADDSYFTLARYFVNNTISLESLNKALYLGDLGEQVVLKSAESFEHIKYTGYEEASASMYFQQKKTRDEKALLMLKDSINKQSFNETFLVDIIRGGWKNDDTRIQRIIY